MPTAGEVELLRQISQPPSDQHMLRRPRAGRPALTSSVRPGPPACRKQIVFGRRAAPPDPEGAAYELTREASLRRQTMATITAAARTMYPHDALPDEVYARVGDKLAEAAEDSRDRAAIEEGVSVLDGDRPVRRAVADQQFEVLKGIEVTEFFELVRSTASSRSTRPADLAAVRLRGPVLRQGRLHRPGVQRSRLAAGPEEAS